MHDTAQAVALIVGGLFVLWAADAVALMFDQDDDQ